MDGSELRNNITRLPHESPQLSQEATGKPTRRHCFDPGELWWLGLGW